MRFQGFIGPTYKLDSVAADCQRLVGMYPELNEAKTAPNGEKGRFVSVPGLRPYLTMGGTIRGAFTASTGDLYVVAGTKFFLVAKTGTVTELGTLLTGTSRVSMDDNGLEVCLVDGTYGYTFNFASQTFARITAGGFVAASAVRHIDGYFVANQVGTKKFMISGLLDGTAWDALDFASIEGTPDDLLTLEVLNKQVWFFKGKSIEVWYDSGAASFPFERITGGLIQVGCASPYCVATLGTTVIWLDSGASGQGVVWAANGYVPERISTHAIERAIQGVRDLSGAYAWSYQDGGHSFYCLTIPYSDTTWCYDLATGLWHERVSLDSHNRRGPCRVTHHAFAYNRHFVAGEAELYRLDHDYHQDGAYPLLRLRTSPHLNSSGKRLFCSKFQLDMETGVVLDGGAAEPQAMLRWSDDRGHTWSGIRTVPIGKIGAFNARAIWRRLGSGTDRVFEVSITDPVPVSILGADLEIQAGER